MYVALITINAIATQMTTLLRVVSVLKIISPTLAVVAKKKRS